MKIRIPLTVEIDRAEYEAEYGYEMSAAEIREGIISDVMAALQAAPYADAVQEIRMTK